MSRTAVGVFSAIASELGKAYKGVVDLDNGVPFDIYELFYKVTGRDYNHESYGDGSIILYIAQAFEEAKK